ncbi:MAG: hypothetical protein AAGJ74_06050 [Pseudomonadota bacterium]
MNAHLATKPSRRSVFGEYAKPAHKSVSRMIGYSLTLLDRSAAEALAAVLAARLTRAERGFLANAALSSLDAADRQIVRDLTP